MKKKVQIQVTGVVPGKVFDLDTDAAVVLAIAEDGFSVISVAAGNESQVVLLTSALLTSLRTQIGEAGVQRALAASKSPTARVDDLQPKQGLVS
jgi:hypothetical protein